MAFRFTPPCCCGSDCLTLCIPACQEIYRGYPNKNQHLRDPDPGVMDQTHTLIDTRSTYNAKTAPDCNYFTVYQSNGNYYAQLSDSYADGNRMIFHVQYRTPGEIEGTWADTSDGIPTGNYLVLTSTNPFDFDLFVNNIVFMDYDLRYHNLVTNNYYKLFCLPFAEPICITDDQPVQLSELAEGETVHDYYYKISGTGSEKHCVFWYQTICNNGELNPISGLCNAKDVRDKMDSITDGKLPGLDFYKVRLFGWGHPDFLTMQGVDAIDGAIASSFVFTFTRIRNSDPFDPVLGTGFDTFPLILGDITTQDCSVDESSFDASTYNTLQGRDYPAALLSYSGVITGSIKASKIILGCGIEDSDNNLSPFDGENSVGSNTEIPTRWEEVNIPAEITTRPNDNTKRFRGDYWLFAEIQPCFENFTQYVTHGVFSRVPVAEFNVNYSSSASLGAIWYSSLTPGRDCQITFSRACESFTLADLRQKWAGRNVPDARQKTEAEYWELYHDQGYVDYLFNRFLIPPTGKILTHFAWRIGKRPLGLIGKSGSSIPGQPMSGGSHRILYDFTTAWKNDNPAYPPWYKCNSSGVAEVHPYDATGTRFSMANPFYNNTNNLDPVSDVNAYPAAHNLNECIETVNGSEYTTFTDSGQTLIFPALNEDKVKQLMNYDTGSIFIGGAANLWSDTNNWIASSVKFYPLFDVEYIAVWENDS